MSKSETTGEFVLLFPTSVASAVKNSNVIHCAENSGKEMKI